MIDRISNLISSEFVRHKVIPEDKKDVYKYGIEIAVSYIIGFAMIWIIGLLFNSLIQTMIFYGAFISLRSMTGIYYTKTTLKTTAVFSVITLFVVIFSKAAYVLQISLGILTLLFLPAVLIFIWLVPIENNSKPIDKKERVYYKITSVVSSILLYVLSFLLYMNQYTLESTVILITIFMVSVLCMIAIIQKGGKTNGKL